LQQALLDAKKAPAEFPRRGLKFPLISGFAVSRS
jgi:hypothetical protein